LAGEATEEVVFCCWVGLTLEQPIEKIKQAAKTKPVVTNRFMMRSDVFAYYQDAGR
jgi:hypothetical protein